MATQMIPPHTGTATVKKTRNCEYWAYTKIVTRKIRWPLSTHSGSRHSEVAGVVGVSDNPLQAGVAEGCFSNERVLETKPGDHLSIWWR